MSMDRCHDCSRAVDTDDDPDCYVEVGNMRRLHQTICLCEPCRDKRENEQDAPDEPPAPKARQLSSRERIALDEGFEVGEEP